jgi:hypothetical protein
VRGNGSKLFEPDWQVVVGAVYDRRRLRPLQGFSNPSAFTQAEKENRSQADEENVREPDQ